MRLICPNCGAQYEVDAQVIPDSGRDVQCSNCGHTWFQRPAHQDADLADELGMDLPDADHGAQAAAGGGQTQYDDEYEDDGWDDGDDREEPAPPADDSDDSDDDEDDTAEDESFAPPPRRELDQDVLGILREEAERETVARQAETGPLESQPDLGIDDGSSGSSGLRERMARLRGMDDGEPVAVPAGPAGAGKRRDLLPDIEEINSTLRSGEPTSSTDDDDYDSAQRRNRGGFGLGFGLVILIALAIAGLYVFAPRIAMAVPALESPLTAYVNVINGLRSWLDGTLQGTVQRLTTLLSQLTSG